MIDVVIWYLKFSTSQVRSHCMFRLALENDTKRYITRLAVSYSGTRKIVLYNSPKHWFVQRRPSHNRFNFPDNYMEQQEIIFCVIRPKPARVSIQNDKYCSSTSTLCLLRICLIHNTELRFVYHVSPCFFILSTDLSSRSLINQNVAEIINYL